MKQGNPADDRLSKFFKVYFPSESGDDLVIPLSFNTFLPKCLPKNVTVRSIYGKNWKLALRKCCGGGIEKYVLVNGWKRIAKDENIEFGDFLEFEFDGSRRFNFCIHKRRTMSKRLRGSSAQSEENKEESDAEVESISSDDDCNSAADDDDIEAVADVRENPSFTATLNLKKISQLRIPAQVIKDYGLNFPEHITVVDPLVTKYGEVEKKIKIQKNGSVFVMGFGSIIRRNQVRTTDKMICELNKTGSNNLVHKMTVTVVSG